MLHGNLMAVYSIYAYGHNRISETKALWLLGFSPSFGKDFDDEVATEQLTGVVDVRVDVTFMPHNDPEIS